MRISEHKMQVIVKSYDKTELRVEVSVEEGKSLIKDLKDNQSIKSNVEELINIRETLGDVLYQPMDEIGREMYTDAAFKMIDKLIKSLEGATNGIQDKR